MCDVITRLVTEVFAASKWIRQEERHDSGVGALLKERHPAPHQNINRWAGPQAFSQLTELALCSVSIIAKSCSLCRRLDSSGRLDPIMTGQPGIFCDSTPIDASDNLLSFVRQEDKT